MKSSNSKPKGKTPSLIGGSLGTPRKRLVQRASSCKRCGQTIQKGVECYEIPHLGGTFNDPKPFCDNCFRSILEKTKADLDAFLVAIQIDSDGA